MYSINCHKETEENELGNRCEPCQTFVNATICGETETLGILREFQNLYEDKLKQIDEQTTKNKSQLKIRLLREWVRDLEEQNTMLVQVVEELEQEASERVLLLEEKLQQSSKVAYQAMTTLDIQNAADTEKDQLQNKITYLENDLKGLLEFIKRIRDNNKWSIDGIYFYNIQFEDIFGSENMCKELIYPLKYEHQIEMIQAELNCSSNKLKNKNEECEILRDKFNKLEKSAKDMRDALTAEVADKHDNIRTLRCEYQLLEEQCRQLDKQTQFKDDIIKEMRKELRTARSKQYLQKLEDIHKIHEIAQQHINKTCEKFRNIQSDTDISLFEYLGEYRNIVEQEHDIIYDLKKEIDNLVTEMHQKEQQILEQNEIIEQLHKKTINVQELLTEVHLKSKKYEEDTENTEYNHRFFEQKILKLQEYLQVHVKERNSTQQEHICVQRKFQESNALEQNALLDLKTEINIIIENLKTRESGVVILENLLGTLELMLKNVRDELSTAIQKTEKYLMQNDLTRESQYKFDELYSQLECKDYEKKQFWNKYSNDVNLQTDKECSEKNMIDQSVEYESLETSCEEHQNQKICGLNSRVMYFKEESNKSQQELLNIKCFSPKSQTLCNEENYKNNECAQSTMIDEDISKLTNTVVQYAKEIELYKKQVMQLQSEQLTLISLRAPTQPLLNNLENYHIKFVESQSTMKNIKNELNSYHRTLINREEKLFYLESKFSTLNIFLQKLQNKLEGLNMNPKQIDLKQIFHQLLSNAQNGLNRLTTDIKKYEEEIHDMECEEKKIDINIQSKENELNNQQEAMLQIQKQIRIENSQAGMLDSQVNLLLKTLYDTRMKIMELQIESKQGIKHYDQDIMNELKKYLKELSEINAKNDILECTVAKMEITIEDCEKKIEECIFEKNQIETRLQENVICLKKLRMQFETLKEENKQTINNNLCLYNENQIQCDKIQELQELLQKAKNKILIMKEESKKHVCALSSKEKMCMINHIDKMKKHFSILQNILNNITLQDDSTICLDLKKEMLNFEKEINVDFNNESLNITSVEHEIDKYKQKISELENSISSKDAIIENLQQAVNLHQNTISELEKQSYEACKAVNCQSHYIFDLQYNLECSYELYNRSCKENLNITKMMTLLQDNNVNLKAINVYLEQCLNILEIQLCSYQPNMLNVMEYFENRLLQKDYNLDTNKEKYQSKIEQLHQEIQWKQQIIEEFLQFKKYSQELIEYLQLLVDKLQENISELLSQLYEKEQTIKELQIINEELIKNKDDGSNKEYERLQNKNDQLVVSCKTLFDHNGELVKRLFMAEEKALHSAELNNLYCFIIDDLQISTQEKYKKINELQDKMKYIENQFSVTQDSFNLALEKEQLIRIQLKQNEEKMSEEKNNYELIIAHKNNELKEMKQHVDGTNKQLSVSIQKVSKVDEEIKLYLQTLELLKSENKSLKAQVNNLQESCTSLETLRQLLSCQLENCLSELYFLQTTKSQLENTNALILQKLNTIQSAYQSQTKENESQTEITSNLETELYELIISRQELCMESKNVIRNIRSWMQEQQNIFKNLTTKINYFKLLVNTLEKEKQNLIWINNNLNEKLKKMKYKLSVQLQPIINENQNMFFETESLQSNNLIFEENDSISALPSFLDNVPEHDYNTN